MREKLIFISTLMSTGILWQPIMIYPQTGERENFLAIVSTVDKAYVTA